MKKQLIFMGPPASGKGTQTIMLAKQTNLPHVDTGSLLRENIANNTDLGVIAKSFVDKGQLVPADVVASIIKAKLESPECAQGFILDGYPRSIEQALTLDEILQEINEEPVQAKAIYMDLDENILLDRIINRRSCPKCGKIYNLKFAPPLNENVCDVDQEALIQRKDDTEEVAKARFETYYSQTAPLIDFYEKRGILFKVDATGSMDDIYQRILQVVK